MTYELLDEPRGDTYKTLLRGSLEQCDHVLLVVRRSLGLDQSGRSVLGRLEPLLLSRREESEWPGTRLTDGTAEVLRYRLTADAVEILAAVSTGLFSWRQPSLPEDPCLIRSDASPWLFTVAHEREAFLTLDHQEVLQLKQLIPALRLASVRSN